MASKPHVLLIIPRGEAVRNFLYSDTLPALSEEARVTLLSVIHDETFRERFGRYADRIVPLETYRESRAVGYLRILIKEAHLRWLWSEVARNRWEVWDHRRTPNPGSAYGRKNVESRHASWLYINTQKVVYTALANRPTLRALTQLENRLTYRRRPTRFFDELYDELQPDLILNGSHIHGSAGLLPIRVAHRMGIKTTGFVFSWDNPTSRSRIMEPYDYFFVWHQLMKSQIRAQYPHIAEDRMFITGTPQFDFHFKPEYSLSRDELAARIGFDPSRPFILYTTGIDAHFPEEHHTLELVIRLLDQLDVPQKPQLVVRTYVKGTSDEMNRLATQNIPDVYFPPMQWDPEWYVPAFNDLTIYTSLLREAALGINAASTVSLELLMHDKPVINLAFDPPGSNLPYPYRWRRHIEFDHYQPVADSGAVMVAEKLDDMKQMLTHGLTNPEDESPARQAFIKDVFGDMDGSSGRRIADCLLELAERHR